jgi:hypothetical protein
MPVIDIDAYARLLLPLLLRQLTFAFTLFLRHFIASYYFIIASYFSILLLLLICHYYCLLRHIDYFAIIIDFR